MTVARDEAARTDEENDTAGDMQLETVITLPDGSYRFDLPDLDGNGINDYIMRMDGNDHSDLEVYLNEDMIFENKEFLPFDISGTASLIDLDRDGKDELFFAVQPHVNSMPMMEYYVLKKQNGTWSRLEYYQQEEEGSVSNAFPISFGYDDDRKTVYFYCGSLVAENVLNLPKYVERVDRETIDSAGYKEQYESFMQDATAAAPGEVSPWGIWDVRLSEYDGAPCIVATHGVDGYDGKYDAWGTLDVFFDFDEAGRIRPLRMIFSENM